MVNKLFVRRRDGRVEVRLNDLGRGLVREMCAHVLAAESDVDHEWHLSLRPPIDPSSDDDDPLLALARENETASNAELVVMSLNEEYLSDAEAWAWLCTLQVALRATAIAHGILSDEKLEEASPELLETIRTLQHFLFDLSACF
ncbi:MAG: hypothetical protein ABSG58_02955 [Acidimicrobiales bacterium]